MKDSYLANSAKRMMKMSCMNKRKGRWYDRPQGLGLPISNYLQGYKYLIIT